MARKNESQTDEMTEWVASISYKLHHSQRCFAFVEITPCERHENKKLAFPDFIG